MQEGNERSFIYLDEILYLECITDKVVSLIKGKIYRAISKTKYNEGLYTNYFIVDENQNPYEILVERDLVGQRFRLAHKATKDKRG